MEATTEDTGGEAKVSPLKAMKLQDEQSLKTWLDQLGTSASIKVIVRRVAPKFFQGTKVSGELMTVEGTFDSDELREQHGGGTYTIAVHRMNKKGEYEHLQTRQLEIIGDPKLDGVFASANVNRPGQAVQQGGSDAVTQAALNMVRDVAKSATERADRAEKSNGTDYALIEKMQAPLVAQLKAAQDDKRALEAKLDLLISKKPETTFQDEMLRNFQAGEHTRLEAVRARHDSEIRMMQEGHRQDVERLHASYKDAANAAERAHEREITNLQRSHEALLLSMRTGADVSTMGIKTALEAQVEAQKQNVARLEREVAKQDQELAVLRAQKVKTPIEAMGELATMKEHMEDLGLVGGEKDDNTAPWERAVGAILQSPIARSIGDRLANTQPMTPAQQQQAQLQQAIAQMPVGQPMRLPDGRVIIKQPDGSIQQVPTAPRKRKKSARQKRVEKLKMTPEDVAKVVNFIETAINNWTPAEGFAASARMMLPSAVLQALKLKGVDWFLRDVAKLSENSPLTTQHGLNWIRQVGRLLVGEAAVAPEADDAVDAVDDEEAS